MAAKKTYIFAISNTEADGTVLHTATCTESQAKRSLFKLVKEDRNTNKAESGEDWDYGTETIIDVNEDRGEFHAYGVYSDYHIDYAAIPLESIDALKIA